MINRLERIRRNRKKVLGLNDRYLNYIRPNNLRSAFRIADNKVLTKQILSANDIPVPKEISVIRNREELSNFDFEELPSSFVIKPVHGVRGGGVEIFYNKDKEGNWILSRGRKMSVEGVKTLCIDILDGKYSLNHEADIVLIEERVKPHKVFRYYTYKGTPDIRIIIFNNIPVMGMLRLPTEQSEGRANLDLGAIGSGIDMAVGKTTSSIMGKSGEIERSPKYKLPLSGLRIPYWNRILRYSIEASKVTGLGFAAIDFLIDKDDGPMIVELNARPGLSIQLANQDGLRGRLKKASGIKVKTTEKGIRLSKDLFGGEIEEEIETISGKSVIGIYENVKIVGLNDEVYEGKAKIDTGADSTSIDKDIAIKLGYENIIKLFDEIHFDESMDKSQRAKFEEELKEKYIGNVENLVDIQFIRSSHGISLRPYVKIQMELDNVSFETKATVFDRSKLSYSVIIGRKSLTKFLVDPARQISS